jgi:hypothetical protein
MKINDLRTTLRKLADQAEDISPPDRLRGIDMITRRDRLRRRATGVAAAVMALTTVGVGVSGVGPWRADSNEPVAQPAPPPEGARIHTITDHGVRIEVDPGNARLIGHRVGWADDGSIAFEVTPTRADLAWAGWCFVPRGSSMPPPRSYMVEVSINGVSNGSRQGPCHRPVGQPVDVTDAPVGDRETRIVTMRERYGVRPGEPAQIEVRLVDQRGDLVVDPDVLLAGGVYETVGKAYVDHGVHFESRTDRPVPGYNYRLLDYRVGTTDGPLTLEVQTPAARTMCETIWHGPDGEAVPGQVTMEVVRPDGTTRSSDTFTDGDHGSYDLCRDGDIVRLTPSPDVPSGRLSIATYEPAD